MPPTLERMSRTEQVRIPKDLAADARIVAAALNESLPEYVARKLREAVKKDMPRASQIVQQRLKQSQAQRDEGSGNGDE